MLYFLEEFILKVSKKRIGFYYVLQFFYMARSLVTLLKLYFSLAKKGDNNPLSHVAAHMWT